MIRKCRVLSVWGVLIGLVWLGASVAWARTPALPSDKMPRFVIPRMDSAPKIDGKMAEGEWQNALAISGVANHKNNLLHPRPTTFYLAWDKQHVYLACRVWVMPGYKPKVHNRQPGSAHTHDAGLELNFKPMGQNVPDGRTDSAYKFNLNALGFTGTYARVSVGQLFKNWRPNFESAASQTKPGTAPNGGSWLEIELAASVDDFELEGPNRAGDVWRMLLGFNHLPMWKQTRIPNKGGYFDPGNFCHITLGENVPAVRATMDQMPGPAQGRARTTFTAHNPTGKPVTLNALARYSDLDKPLIERKEKITVKPGATAQFTIDKPIEANPDPGSIFYRVQQGDRTLLRYFTYFKVGHAKEDLTHEPSEAPFPFRARFNPVRFNVMVRADAYYLEDPSRVKALHYEIRPKGGGEAIASGTIDDAQTFYYRRLVQLPELSPGQYTVQGRLALKNGDTLGPITRDFEKLNEKKKFAQWWNNNLGNTDRVIPPFEAMTHDGATVGMWGRSYELNALGLPRAIESQGNGVLAQPARLVVVIGGETHRVPLKGTPEFTQSEKWRVAFNGEVEVAGVQFRTQGFVEQDGLAKLELTYAPTGAQPVTIDALRIEFPLKDKTAASLLCIGPGGNYSARTTKLLDGDEQGELWSTLDTGRNGSGMTVGSFYPQVWLGNERRGLLWWADNDKGWVPRNDVPAHDVVRTDEAVVLRNNLIGKSYELSAARTVTFSYMASPFRPLVDGWRYGIRSEDGTFGGPHKRPEDPETGERTYDGWHLLTPPTDDPSKYGEMWAGYKKHADEKVRKLHWRDPYQARRKAYVHTSLPLMGYGWKSDDPSVKYFQPEWGGRESYSRTNRDYYSYLVHRAINEGGIRTIYWDIFFPKTHGSLQNGLAYQLPDGRIQPGYNGFNIRRFMMRNYAIMHDAGIAPGAQVAHATNAYLLVAAPWVDAILDGEFHKINPDSQMDWVDGYPIAQMRALANTHNFGTVITWMNKLEGSREFRKRQEESQADYTRLFDSWYVTNGPRLTEEALRFGMNGGDVRFVPFWRNTAATSEDPDVLISMWRLPDRVMLNVFNYNGEETKNVTLKLNLESLNLVPERKLLDFLRVRNLDPRDADAPEVELNFYERTLNVPKLAPHTGRLIGIRRY